MEEEKDIYGQISEIDGNELNQVLDHVLFCFTQLNPQWSTSVISMDKCEDRKEQIHRMITFLESLKESPALMEPSFIKV